MDTRALREQRIEGLRIFFEKSIKKDCSTCSIEHIKTAASMVDTGLSNYSRRDLERFIRKIGEGE